MVLDLLRNHLILRYHIIPILTAMSSTSWRVVNKAPEGTKLWLLHLGNLEADLGFFIRGGGTSTKSNPNPDSQRGRGVIISALIEHPTEGLILFETGAGPDYPDVWGEGSRRYISDSCLSGT